MSSPSREFFTLDLRGLRAGLKARAASLGLTESSVVRSILAAALDAEHGDSSVPSAGAVGPMIAPQIKMSVRMPRTAASRLDRHARAAGLSRGVYLMRLIDGAPPVVASSDRAAMFYALNASSNELALLSRDMNHLTGLLRQGSFAAAREYTSRHDSVERIVQAHLALAAPILSELSFMRLTAKRGVAGQRVGIPP